MARRLDARATDFESAFTELLNAKRESEEDVAASVRAIVADVRARGDAALVDYAKRFDKIELTALRLT
jgi:histidinol dehydrogenase